MRTVMDLQNDKQPKMFSMSVILYSCVILNAVFITVVIVRDRDIVDIDTSYHKSNKSWMSGDNAVYKTHADKEKEKHIIIMASKETGSSFLGEILNRNPKVMFVFEPLQKFTTKVPSGKMKASAFDGENIDLIDRIFKCNFDIDTFSAQQKPIFCSNSRVFSESALCSTKNITHVAINNLTDVCLTYQYRAMKTIRLWNIELLKTLAVDPAIHLKIIHLVRDPRGIMNSRNKLNQRNKDFQRKGDKLDEVTELCKDLSHNLHIIENSASWLKNRYMLVRYEDIAKDPHAYAKHIYDFIDLELPLEVQQWISKSAKQTEGGKYSTTQDFAAVATRWRYEISFSDIRSVQEKCAISMESLGYKEVKTSDELENEKNVLGYLPKRFSITSENSYMNINFHSIEHQLIEK
ncbi:carbohydrate sulfotransferase 1-like [Saccoglossus kowalevskii]